MEGDSGRAKGILAGLAIMASVAVPFLVFFAGVLGAYSSTGSVSGSVTVASTCYIALSANTINFGTLAPGQYADNGYTTVGITDNDVGGNTNANVVIYGTNWIVGGGSPNFGVSNTFWAGSNILDTAANSLTLTAVNTGIPVTSSVGNTVYFGLLVPSAQAQGSYTQNIVVTNSC